MGTLDSLVPESKDLITEHARAQEVWMIPSVTSNFSAFKIFLEHLTFYKRSIFLILSTVSQDFLWHIIML
jgi:hypothetical protein